ncbi:MAG: histidine phosphatase family protein [Kofleriaceae bacterium]
MADLLLIRHGQARYGEADYDRLSERGHAQARYVGRELGKRPPSIVFTGPLRRQVETYASARAAAEAEGMALPEPIEVAELAEYPAFELIQALMPRLSQEEARFADLAKADARTREAAFQTMIHRWGSGAWNAPGVETAAQFAARVQAGLHQAMEAAGGGRLVAVVTSAGPIGVAMGLANGGTTERMIHLSRVIQNASFSQVRFRGQDAPPAMRAVGKEAAAAGDGAGTAGARAGTAGGAAGAGTAGAGTTTPANHAEPTAWPLGWASMFTFNVTAHLPPELVTDR